MDFAETFSCPTCRAEMQLVQVGAYNIMPESPRQAILFGHCLKCANPAMVEVDEIGMSWTRGRQLYPSLLGVDAPLPQLVQESYAEARRCFSAGAHIATAVMVRRTLEAITREFDPRSKRLFDGLKTMFNQGLISAELSQWGDELRFLGNIGAHPSPSDKVTAVDADDALEFLDAIVETLYRLRPRFQAMRARRNRGAASTSATGQDPQAAHSED